MTQRLFEKKVTAVLESKYQKYQPLSHKVWKEDGCFHLSVRFGADRFRTEPWGINAVFDKNGKSIQSNYGSRRDLVFTKILVQRIEEECGR